MFAALYVFVAVGTALFVINLIPLLGPGRWSFAAFITPIRRFLDTYTEMISDLTLAASDAVDHDRCAGDHRRSDQARQPS